MTHARPKTLKAVTFYGTQWERGTFPREWKVSGYQSGVAGGLGCKERDSAFDGGTKRHLEGWSVGDG